MVDRGKVIFSIERCICHVPDACRDCAYDAGHPHNECVELLLKDALSLLKAQEVPDNGGWISVKDRLPDNGQDVLVYLDDGEETRVAPCNYANGVWFDCVMNRVATLHHITHWMPLPEPPKEET